MWALTNIYITVIQNAVYQTNGKHNSVLNCLIRHHIVKSYGEWRYTFMQS